MSVRGEADWCFNMKQVVSRGGEKLWNESAWELSALWPVVVTPHPLVRLPTNQVKFTIAYQTITIGCAICIQQNNSIFIKEIHSYQVSDQEHVWNLEHHDMLFLRCKEIELYIKDIFLVVCNGLNG